MISDQVRDAISLEPFRPFVMHLADGREIPIRHREFVMALPTGRTVIVAQPDGSFNVVDLPLVTDLEFKSLSSGNGKGRRKSGRE